MGLHRCFLAAGGGDSGWWLWRGGDRRWSRMRFFWRRTKASSGVSMYWKKVHFFGGDGSGVGQGFEVEHVAPVLRAVDQDCHLLGEPFRSGLG